MRKQWVVLLAAVAACGSPPSLAPVRGPTLLVTNQGLGRLALYDQQGRLATLLPNERRCVLLRYTQSAQTLRYAIEGEMYETPTFYPETLDGWRLEVGTTPAIDRLSLRPLDEPCRPGRGQLAP